MDNETFQICMFHFRCALCGASPERVLLRDYLKGWNTSSSTRLYHLLCSFGGAMKEIRDRDTRRNSKKFLNALDQLHQSILQLPFDRPLESRSLLRLINSRALFFERECPMCKTAAGERKVDNYFSDWTHACGVQTANLLYETGLILWAVLVSLPVWANGVFLQKLNKLRDQIRSTGKAMSLLECPQCGRLTTCLYGYPEPERNGFCRWCLDMGGGLGLSFSLELDAEGKPNIKKIKTDYTAPAKNAWDVLPPEVGRRLGQHIAERK
jgi:hypothetical protein